METHHTKPLVPLLVALPQVVLVAVGLCVLGRGAVGVDRQWTDVPANLSTAIIVHDWGQAIRRIEQGEDPNQAHLVPDGFAGPGDKIMTPLEAAVREDELDLVVTLVRAGAVPGAGERLRLSCLALSRDAGDIAEYLSGTIPTPSECAGAIPAETSH